MRKAVVHINQSLQRPEALQHIKSAAEETVLGVHGNALPFALDAISGRLKLVVHLCLTILEYSHKIPAPMHPHRPILCVDYIF